MKTELKQFRSLNAKHFDNGDGTFEYQPVAGQIHYDNKLGVGDGVKGWRGIDCKLHWDDVRKGWYFQYHSYNPFLPEYADQWCSFRDLFADKDQTTKYRPVCNHVKGRIIEGDIFLKGFEGVLYEDAFGDGIDLIYCFGKTLFKKLIRFRKYPTKDAYYDFELELPENKKFYRGIDKSISYELDLTREKEFDTDKRSFIGGVYGTYLRPFMIWDSGKVYKQEIVKVNYFLQDGKKYLRKKIPVSFFADAQGDVFTDTTTSYYVGSGEDGLTRGFDASWDTAHDEAGDLHGGNDTRVVVMKYANVIIYRVHFPMDTSGIPDNATISSVTFYAYCNTVSIGDDDGDDLIALVKSFMNDPTTLEDGDFEDCGETSGGGAGTAMNTPIVLASDDEKDASAGSTGWWSWVLNSYGLSNISKTTYSCFGLREGHDYKDQTIAQNTENNIFFNDSQDASNNPYLSVTYTVPNVPMFKVNSGLVNAGLINKGLVA